MTENTDARGYSHVAVFAAFVFNYYYFKKLWQSCTMTVKCE